MKTNLYDALIDISVHLEIAKNAAVVFESGLQNLGNVPDEAIQCVIVLRQLLEGVLGMVDELADTMGEKIPE